MWWNGRYGPECCWKEASAFRLWLSDWSDRNCLVFGSEFPEEWLCHRARPKWPCRWCQTRLRPGLHGRRDGIEESSGGTNSACAFFFCRTAAEALSSANMLQKWTSEQSRAKPWPSKSSKSSRSRNWWPWNPVIHVMSSWSCRHTDTSRFVRDRRRFVALIARGHTLSVQDPCWSLVKQPVWNVEWCFVTCEMMMNDDTL